MGIFFFFKPFNIINISATIFKYAATFQYSTEIDYLLILNIYIVSSFPR